ncbi:cleavage factor protein [Schizopora paradoxa]|uniref:DNA damage-binding protein 1 n=1 Tax=Schizopora paradoxa TaxID=27342 RepID=A0A0H2RWL1_9AGAM|nr:cleavage factor protein [Schizopora paradoxa]
MFALRRELVSPSGVEYATSLKLIPSTIFRSHPSNGDAPQAIANLVVARSNTLRIYEIQEEDSLAFASSSGKDNWPKAKKDTEAVEGEAEIEGEGFVNLGLVKSAPTTITSSTTLRFYLVREHRLHGIVTGLASVKLSTSLEDNLDRLLVSFKDAKIALLEWSSEVHDLIPVSIHTYERAPQMSSFDPKQYREIPYEPSFLLDLASEVDTRIRDVVDYTFLPGYINPTVAVLFQNPQTWAGRLKEHQDTAHLFIFTLDLVTRKYPVITAVENLPHDSMSIHPCDPSLGGLIVLTPNSIIYVDQASRKTALPVNGWAQRISDMAMQSLHPDELERDLSLEGASASFVDEKTFFIVLKDGTVYPVEIIMEGRLVSRLSMGAALAQTTIPTTMTSVSVDDRRFLFVGSTVGASVLLKAFRTEEEIPEGEKKDDAPAAVVDAAPTIDFDDEDDIYGDIKTSQSGPGQLSNGQSGAVERRSVLHLSMCDSLPAHGPVSDMAFALTRNGDKPIAELITATGYGRLGGFTLFQKDLPTRLKKKVHVVGGARGVWSLPIRQSTRSGGASSRPHASVQQEMDTVLVSTDANPSPGLTRFAARTSRGDSVSITTRRTETTISAAPFFQRTAILHVTSDMIRVLEPDCSERQCIKDMDGVIKRPKIRYCNISDPFVLIIREDESLGLFVGNSETGRIRRKDMTAMGEKVSRYSAGCFFMDQSGVLEAQSNPSADASEKAESVAKSKTSTASLEATVDPQRGSQWLILCRPQGVIEIWTLPKLSIVFSSSLITDLPPIISDTFDPPALSLPDETPRAAQELDIDQIQMAPLGDTHPQPHLMVLLRCGQFAVYQAIPDDKMIWPDSSSRSSSLSLKFSKVMSRAFEPRKEVTEKSTLSEQRRILRTLVPFTTSPSADCSISGVFFTGDQPCWIFASSKDGVRIHTCGYAVGDFFLYTDEGPCLLEWMPGINIGTSMPSKSVTTGKHYTNVTFNAPTGLIVAASSLPGRFGLYDEEGNSAWERDAANVNYPFAEASSLELYTPDFSCVVDGYEFMPNEFVNALECIPLETQSTESGSKEYVVVGTTINRGEDLAVKGATYIFEIVEVVANPEDPPSCNFKLRLLCRDDAKGPVTAVCGLNGYLVSTMGQKLFVRAFDLDERLVGVAFLDVGLYVTSIRTIKNLLLIGDVAKSVWFVAFQEDPFKLVIIAKDVQHRCVTSADFLFSAEGQFYIALGDEDGVLRLLEYEPTDPESRNGQFLLCRSEFHGQVDSRCTALVARRVKGDEGSIPQAKLISGASDGSMYSLTPIDEITQKRLELLQGQLTRSIQHVAGLNPKAFRMVRNDLVSKPLSKLILDGNLLSHFPELSISRQKEITRQIGTDRADVLRDWASLSGPW